MRSRHMAAELYYRYTHVIFHKFWQERMLIHEAQFIFFMIVLTFDDLNDIMITLRTCALSCASTLRYMPDSSSCFNTVSLIF
jgi:hypothetical protein